MIPRSLPTDEAINKMQQELDKNSSTSKPAIVREVASAISAADSAPKLFVADKVLITEFANRDEEEFETEEFKDFCASIEMSNGNEVPGKVYKLDEVGPNGEEYALVYGNRRLVACRRTGVKFKAFVVPKPDARAWTVSMHSENTNRTAPAVWALAKWYESRSAAFDSIASMALHLKISSDRTLGRYLRVATLPTDLIDLVEKRLDMTLLGLEKMANAMHKDKDQFDKRLQELKTKAAGSKLPFKEILDHMMKDPAKLVKQSESTAIVDKSGNEFGSIRVNRAKELRLTIADITETELRKITDVVNRLRA